MTAVLAMSFACYCLAGHFSFCTLFACEYFRAWTDLISVGLRLSTILRSWASVITMLVYNQIWEK